MRRSADNSLVVTHELRLQQQRLTMEPPQERRVCAWQTDMEEDERTEFQQFAGETLRSCGYS